MDQDTSTHSLVTMIHSCLPGPGMSLILPALNHPGLDEEKGTCRTEYRAGPRVGMEKGLGRKVFL